ncbi:hypothetical protein [Rhizobium sp. NZLR11]|uniref:hypothetical protein n=1 Tax=Rhizobium sp. NZLR11 TaxID=2731098 RepID=UPI001C82D2DC|nr:hypothetical protein [Rhizobium sp. NZLR11]MBX5206672.1 hypothetical protein [Rhizobium sp. NZLR11]
MITADPHSKLGLICSVVDRMKPGECLDLMREELMDIPSFEHNQSTFNPADRVLGNIVGSAYTHSYRVSADGRKVTFMRHENTGAVRYHEPDEKYRRERLR